MVQVFRFKVYFTLRIKSFNSPFNLLKFLEFYKFIISK